MPVAAAQLGDAVQHRRLDVGLLLRLAREHLGMELSWVARIEGEEQVVRQVDGCLPSAAVQVGTRARWLESVCQAVGADQGPVVVPDLARHARAATHSRGLRAYAGAPIRLRDGRFWGTLCCGAADGRDNLTDEQVAALAFVARLAGELLADDESQDVGLAAVRSRIEQVLADGGPRTVYQGAYGLETGEPQCFEALSRFPAGHGTPDAWFADAARVGLGVELELAAAASGLRALDVLPAHLGVAVNLSPAAITDPRSIALIAGLGAARARRVVVEVTEHVAVDDYPDLRAAVAALRDLGADLAADDTGAGYAGLQHLVELGPSAVKMDRALTRGIDTDVARQAAAASLVTYCRATGGLLVAEGVETPGELRTIRAMGVPIAQGFLLHRPQPLEELCLERVVLPPASPALAS